MDSLKYGSMALDGYGRSLVKAIVDDVNQECSLGEIVSWAYFTLNRLGRTPDYMYPESDPAALFAYLYLVAIGHLKAETL